MSKQLVSILIPCFNAEKWLAETLESTLAQTWRDIEIILVDDGSTDRSLATANRFTSSKVKVINQPKQGASAARNRALQEAQGQYIQYLDADDLLAPDKLEHQIRLLQENPDAVSVCEWGRFDNSVKAASFFPEATWNDMHSIDWLTCSWNGGGMMPIHAWLVPRTIIEQAGAWNESLSLNDDGEYFSRVLLSSNGVKFCWGVKVYYRSGLTNNLSQAKSRAALESAFHSLELSTTHLLAVENSPHTQHACATAYQRFIYSTYPDAPGLVQQAEAKVRALGGTELKPPGGVMFKVFANTVGWKIAKQVQQAYYQRKFQTLTQFSVN